MALRKSIKNNRNDYNTVIAEEQKKKNFVDTTNNSCPAVVY